MFIAISGTPGTGKTAAAKILSRMLKAKLITTDFLIKKYKIKTSYDRKRKTKIIDTKKLAAVAKQEAKKHRNRLALFESHLSHFAAADLTIILRTNPAELEKRLKKKKWRENKIRENVEAEAIGVISYSCRKKKNIIEIDTTEKSPKQTAELIIRLLKSRGLQKRYSPGKMDWSKIYAMSLASVH